MANTTADKLAKLSSTKAALKSAINGSGSTVGDVFSEYPTAITSGKSAIAQAITGKGMETAADATFQQMAENIGSIQLGAKITTSRNCDEILEILEKWSLESAESSILIIRVIFKENDSSVFEFSCANGQAYSISGTLYLYGNNDFFYDVLEGEAANVGAKIFPDPDAYVEIHSEYTGFSLLWELRSGIIEGEGIAEVEVTLIEQN